MTITPPPQLNEPMNVMELDTQHEKVDESTIYCGYGCKNTETRKREKKKKNEQPVTPHWQVQLMSDSLN